MKLLMFSCGIDSTYLAWKLMSLGVFLHLHHVSIRGKELLWKKQDERVKPILSYFDNRRFKYAYSESTFDMRSYVGFDSDLLLLVAQKVCQNFSDNWIEVYMGWNPTDMERIDVAERATRNVTPNIWKALVQGARNRHKIDETLHFPLIEQNLRKADIIKEMPKTLLDLTYSCRRGTECGECLACRDIKNALSSD